MSVFHLKIKPDPTAGNNCFTVLAEYPVEGGQDLDQPEPVKFVPSDKFTMAFHRLHSRENASMYPRFMNYPTHEVACTLIGQELFDAFFVGQARERYEQYRQENKPPRIALHLPPQLYTYPWEVLRDKHDTYGQFLATLGSVIRYDQEVGDEVAVQALESLDFLFLLSTPQDQPRIGFLEPIDEQVMKFLKVKPATYKRFLEGLQKQHQGFIFYGHGQVIDESGVLTGALIFEREDKQYASNTFWSDPRYAYTIGNAIGQAVAQPMTAFILACESAWVDTQVDFDMSVAGALLKRTQMAFIIAAQTPIDFLAGQEIFKATLRALGEDRLPLDLAVGQARRAVRDNLALDAKKEVFAKLDWWVPVLYARAKNFDILPRPVEAPVHVQPATLTKTPVLSQDEPVKRPVGQQVRGVVSATLRMFKDIIG